MGTAMRVYSLLIVAVAVAVALAAPAAAKVVHNTPQQQLRRRFPASNKAPALVPPFMPRFDAEQMEYLNAHNDFRRALAIPPLVWDANLAKSAHAWALKRRRDCNARRHSKTRYGQNIFVMDYREFAPRDVVKFWFDENKLYDGKRKRCKCHPEGPGCECGHFLNIVWKTTARMGCSGAVYCDNQKGTFIVCDYDPPGLTPGINPFTGFPL